MKICIVGEAWGEQEDRQKMPFVGPAGQELTRMLQDAGIDRDECHLTNVFNFRPPGNDIDKLCLSKREFDETVQVESFTLPPIRTGKYLHPQYYSEILRLQQEITELKPNLVIATGAVASWALLQNSAIGKIKGTVHASTLVPGQKVIPIYHPSAILRDWSLRAATIIHLAKCAREAGTAEIRRPHRTVRIAETLQDIDWWLANRWRQAEAVAFDIETAYGQITCIGFATTEEESFVIPIIDPGSPNGSYWSFEDENAVWAHIEAIMRSTTPKVAQNGIYDIQYLWVVYGIPVMNFRYDTMLMHHAMYPESPKGLDELGALYTDNPSWKTWRPRGFQAKADE